jgi:transcriptional regulator with XRE-family HTH domain
MVCVIQIGQTLTLATLISERCRVLGLSQAEFVNRVGCQDIQKGIRLLHQLFDGDRTRTEALIEAISAALDLPDSVVGRAAQVSQRLLAERRRRHFEPEETTGHADKSAGSIVPHLRLISN